MGMNTTTNEALTVGTRVLCQDDDCIARGTFHIVHPCVFFPAVMAVTHVDEHGGHWSRAVTQETR